MKDKIYFIDNLHGTMTHYTVITRSIQVQSRQT